MKKWVILVFMAADNNLEYYAFKNIHDMERVGSSEDIDVVVQIDRYGDGNKGSTLRGTIVKNPDWQPFKYDMVSPMSDIGETDTGDPKVLQEFVEWGVTNHEAEHYALIIWNHGSGWKPDFIYKTAEDVAGPKMAAAMRSADFATRYGKRLQRIVFRKTAEGIVSRFIEKSIPSAAGPAAMARMQAPTRNTLVQAANEPDLTSLVIRAIGLDESSGGDALDSLELKSALHDALMTISAVRKSPFKLDILGFDACLMAGLEVAFQTREFSSYLVGSEEIEPSLGWAYGAFIEELTRAQGQLVARDLCNAIVKDYNEGVRNVGVHLTTQSAIDMSKVTELAVALNDLGKLIEELISTQYGLVARAEKTATRFYDTDFLDLGDFVSLVSAQTQDKRLEKIKQILKDATVASLFSFSSGRQCPTGLSVYFPTRPIYDEAYSVLDLTKSAPGWRDAIRAYHFLS